MLNSTSFNNEWELWGLSYTHNVWFDGVQKTIFVHEGVIELNVKDDLYSRWKEWVMVNDMSKFLKAFSIIGGDPIPGGALGATIFLTNGWRIKPYIGEYRLVVNGNLYTEEGDDPYISTSGVSVSSVVSDLNTVQTATVVQEVVSEVLLNAETLTLITNAYTEARLARQLASNKAVISSDDKTVTIYDDDGTTILWQFNISDDKRIRTVG